MLALVFLFGADEAVALMRLFGVFVVLVGEASDFFANLLAYFTVQFLIVDGLIHEGAHFFHFLLYLLLAEHVQSLITGLLLRESYLQVLAHLVYRLVVVLRHGRPV